MTDEQINTIITSVQPEVIEVEHTWEGTRPKRQRYRHEAGVLVEMINYLHPAKSDGWAAETGRTYSEADLDELPVFRTWNISDHPQHAAVYRRVDLIEMEVDATRVKLLVLVKHFTNAARTTRAPYATVLVPMFGENDMQVPVPQQLQDLGYPATMGERDFWHLLTELGQTVYNMLDARMVELDNVGRFNNIYE